MLMKKTPNPPCPSSLPHCPERGRPLFCYTGNLVGLIEEGCSVPFIARYRQEQTNHMAAEKIREVIANLEDLR